MTRPATDNRDKLAGAVWGHLVGDAIGVPYESKAPDDIGQVTLRGGGSHGQPPGTWSDDGALMLALLDSLLTAGFDTHDQARRMLAWADDGSYTPDGDALFDIGIGTRAAIARLRRGVPPEEAGGTGERDYGNGSLMRILPVALVDGSAPTDVLVDHAHRASSLTHRHTVCQAACALYCLAVRGVLAGERGVDAIIPSAAAQLRDHYQRLTAAGAPFLAALDTIEGWTGRSGRGYVVDSFWSAWDSFAGADDYRSTIERAVAYGHDTDTTACIAGGLAGAYWGITGIPEEWRDALRGRAIVEPLVHRLLESRRVAGAPGA